jgi:hypothetical protein
MKSGMGIRDIVGQGVEPAIAAAPRKRRNFKVVALGPQAAG